MTLTVKLVTVLFTLSTLLLASCGSPVVRDSGPTKAVDLSGVVDAVPRHDRRTRAGNNPSYKVLGKTYQVLPDSKGFRQQGVASWYGRKFHGRKTSNGEIYDMYAMTAAHKTLPIPTYARVTNHSNGRSVVVRVNDRGPFHDDRVIDLSFAAASKLGYANSGTAKVSIEAIETGNNSLNHMGVVKSDFPKNKKAYIQMGAFGQKNAAQKLLLQLKPLVSQRLVISRASDANLYRVRIGPLSMAGDVKKVQNNLLRSKLGSGFVVFE